MIPHPDDEAHQQALFKRWLELHSGLIFKVARAFAPGAADRDDLAQEIVCVS